MQKLFWNLLQIASASVLRRRFDEKRAIDLTQAIKQILVDRFPF